jgi:Skp family chaperone for outer membrane proteins
MKIKTIVLVCLAVSAALLMTDGFSWAGSKGTPATRICAFGNPKIASGRGVKIGVVSVLKIFQNCKGNEQYRQSAVAERARDEAELEKLSKEIEAEEAGLRTLKIYKQQAALKEHLWTERVYKDILRITAEVAKEKGLDIVLEKDEPEFPLSNYTELMTVISTHKVLYSSGCVDISDEVMARLDAEQ